MTPPLQTAVRLLAGLARNRKAATAVEYGLILALIVIALIAGATVLGGETKATWTSISNRVSAATGY